LGEPSLSPKRERKEMAASYATVDIPSDDDEDGSIRSLGTAEVFSPRTSYAATNRSAMGSSSMLFSREVMSLGESMDDSVRTSASLEGGVWSAKGGRKGLDKYYGMRLDESFGDEQSRKRRIKKMDGNKGAVSLSRGGRHDQAKWDKLYEEQYSGSSSSDGEEE